MEKVNRKGFISVYVLLILLALGLTISFIYRENENNYQNTVDLYNKKIAMFEAESLVNMIVEENRAGSEKTYYDLLNNFDSLAKLEIHHDSTNNKVIEAKDAKTLSVRADYKGTVAYAIMIYKMDENNKIKLLYKKVY